MNNLYSTIAAISTPHGVGGISVIRISGTDAIKIADKIFFGAKKKKLSEADSHTVWYGHIKNKDGKIIDEVMCTVMKSPNTFTGEDTVEISCHGGLLVTKRVLEEVLSQGAVSASRGEFTKRAFLNGKTDLCRAEAVIDLINSKTEMEKNISVNHLEGALSKEIDKLRNRLLNLLSHLQVLIDYPDEDLEPLSDEEFSDELRSVRNKASHLLKTSEAGTLIKNGINTTIAGKPNVGKSSLLNLLSGEEKAIVTDIEGTTRDAIEQSVTLGDIVLNLTDTAGIRKTDDKIESIGVEKSKECIKKAKLVIFMTDAASGINSDDTDIIKSLDNKNVIVLINKSDIGNSVCKKTLEEKFSCVIDFSVKTKLGLKNLEDAIKEKFEMGSIEENDCIITSVRHRQALMKAIKSLDMAIDAINNSISIDTTFIDIEEAISSLGEIVGLTVSEEVVDKIFHSFCVGK